MEPDIARIRAIEVYTAELSTRAFFRVCPLQQHGLNEDANIDQSVNKVDVVSVKNEDIDDTEDEESLLDMLPPEESRLAKLQLSDSDKSKIPFLFASEIYVRLFPLTR